MPKNKKWLLGFFYILALGCQTYPYKIEESNISLKDNRKAVVAAIGDPKSVSENGREIYSHYHNKYFKVLDEPELPKARYYTKVVVLGVRRPYEVSVEVHKEQKDPETRKYMDQGIDEGLTQKRVISIQGMLNQSREKAVPAFDVENPF